MQATELLKNDHHAVEQLLTQLEATPEREGDARQRLLDTIAEELEIHAMIEEEIFYPAVRQVSGMIGEAESEHSKIKSLVGGVEGLDPSSEQFAAKARELQQIVLHHVSEEEGPIFRDAARLGAAELDRLGRRLEERKQELKTSMLERGKRAAKQAVRKIA